MIIKLGSKHIDQRQQQFSLRPLLEIGSNDLLATSQQSQFHDGRKIIGTQEVTINARVFEKISQILTGLVNTNDRNQSSLRTEICDIHSYVGRTTRRRVHTRNMHDRHRCLR
ncbi:hypothetical protein WK78_19120 [Burkholderia cepacia]|nr:hypothetical protein WK78_19120 [Burkholderia cepacia]